jgi:hypothetical protein
MSDASQILRGYADELDKLLVEAEGYLNWNGAWDVRTILDVADVAKRMRAEADGLGPDGWPEWIKEEARRRGVDAWIILAELQGHLDGRPRPPEKKEEG